LVPVMITVVPTTPLAGVKLVMDGDGVVSSSFLQDEIKSTLAIIIAAVLKERIGHADLRKFISFIFYWFKI